MAECARFRFKWNKRLQVAYTLSKGVYNLANFPLNFTILNFFYNLTTCVNLTISHLGHISSIIVFVVYFCVIFALSTGIIC